MTAATVTQASTETVDTRSAGDIAIELASKAGANNATLLKAVWSTRGTVRAEMKGFEFGVAINKSDLTGMLKNLPPAEEAAFLLVPQADGAMLIAKAG